MKKLFSIIFFCLFLYLAHCQNFYNIKGEPVEIAKKSIVICYNTNICHGCMISLVDYCQKLSAQYSDIKFYVLIQGGPITLMRTQTSALYDYFNRNELPTVLYDLNPKERGRYFNKHKIREFPALLLSSSEKKRPHFVSYRKLFEDNGLAICVSNYANNKIFTFFELTQIKRY